MEGIQEVVVIENLGDAVQTLADWELQSDPPDSETFDLTVLGGLEESRDERQHEGNKR